MHIIDIYLFPMQLKRYNFVCRFSYLLFFDRTSLLSDSVTYYDDWTRAMLSNGAVDLGNGWFYYER